MSTKRFTNEQIDRLLRPKSVAVIGASDRTGALGATLLNNLVQYEFDGEIYPVNPKRDELLGLKVYHTADELPEGIDCAVIAIGALLPWTRPMFLNNNYATLSGALLASMIIIPLQTVIPEELAFRGVLHGALDRAWGWRGVAAAGSLLFGLWHIATSMGLTASNVGFTKILGGGVFGMVAGVVGAVLATGAAGYVFAWLRRRSGSLIAPIALHWSLNGLGALAAALVWHLS